MTGNITLLIINRYTYSAVLGGVTLIAHIYSLNGIKSRTVGDGQHGTARWANRSEIRKTYKHVPFTPEQWREQAKESKPPVTPDGQPLPQGIVVGCTGNTTAMVDTGDVHALMIGAAGVGKTAYWLYPCIEYACASGMSFLSTDTKGDIMRNYGQIAKDYGYHISVIDLTVCPIRATAGWSMRRKKRSWTKSWRSTARISCTRPCRPMMMAGPTAASAR